MAHDNPVFYVTTDLTLKELNRQRNSSGLSGVTPTTDTHPCTNPSVIAKNLKKMCYCRWRWNWFINTLIILSLCGMIIVMEFDILTFHPIGFSCKDPKISHKFMGDTISFSYLMIVTVAVPLIAISLVEMLVLNQRAVYKDDKKENLKGLKQAWYWYSQFFFGLLLVIFITEAGKSIVAEPRPHFLETCQPDKAVNCTSGHVYDFKCTNINVSKYRLKDSFRSFPSGHSSIGLYMAVFMIWYFQNRIPSSGFLIVPWLQCVFLFWGIICSLTRITDRRHHWWDVLAGSVCGALVAAFTVKILCRNFHKYHSRTLKCEKSINGGGNNIRHTSSRRLLSSTSSCGTPPDDRELREVQAT